MDELLHQLDDATNVLLAEPSIGQSRDVCTSLLLDRREHPNVLFVTYTRQPSACLDQVASDVERVGVITVGDGPTAGTGDGVVVESVSTPSDLTGLGIKIGQFLREWEAPLFVCFDSLTPMLQYVEFQTAYEFLHAITGQIYAAGATSHFHIDPQAHDETHVAGITSLFDAKVSLDGEPTVRTRTALQTFRSN